MPLLLTIVDQGAGLYPCIFELYCSEMSDYLSFEVISNFELRKLLRLADDICKNRGVEINRFINFSQSLDYAWLL